jgi:hypothetical protein
MGPVLYYEECMYLEVTCMNKIITSIRRCDDVQNFKHIINNAIITCCTVVLLMLMNPVLYFRESFFNGIEIRRIGWKVLDANTWHILSRQCRYQAITLPKRSTSSRISSPWWILALSIIRTLSGPGYAVHLGSCTMIRIYIMKHI